MGLENVAVISIIEGMPFVRFQGVTYYWGNFVDGLERGNIPKTLVYQRNYSMRDCDVDEREGFLKFVKEYIGDSKNAVFQGFAGV